MGLVAGVAAFSGTGSSTLNGDELATISAAGRSLAGMFELARHIDGHFLPYYLFMHFWVKAGTAELWLRLPSAVAIGEAAWFLVELGRRLHSTRAGVVAAGVFAILPSVSYYGAFARSYAFAAAAVVFSFWALHRAVEAGGRPGLRRWVVYGVAVALVCSTHLFAVLVLPAQVLLMRRAVAVRMMVAMAVGCVPAAVLGLIGYGERHAISWIPERGPEVWLKFPKMAAGADTLGVVLFVMALAGAVLFWRTLQGAAVLRSSTGGGRGGGVWAFVLVGWLVLPPVLLLLVSWAVTPVYVDRYLFVTAPALALLAGLAVAALPRFHVVAGVVVVVLGCALAFPDHVDVREENGRFENIPWALRVIKAEPEDAIVYGQSQLRTGFDYYADSLMPVDVLRTGDAPDPDGFGYPERSDVSAVLKDRERVWVVWRGTKKSGLEGDAVPRVGEVERAGFELTLAKHSVDLPGLTVALFTRDQETAGQGTARQGTRGQGTRG
ncbi:dolichyl-phosphate-mannose-protein mannosyltransferase [Nonomuraea fuscirosea]|uniref:Dolichyl-phosphate-mannose-protein mannosyltransferase n=1 Tax=Nonomuraea fuscirosea TaxID=1291556 RepID=A0A2T0MP94_9ACTN|nr:glycosyltransferase family 39 protein [Nonomuraea fuscirosea]PRX59788.1 dolichyl-phosphate-mannose-protein mannosyltransferase [Nonomuraea fuscirosea]